jgi:hypothetical protein
MACSEPLDAAVPARKAETQQRLLERHQPGPELARAYTTAAGRAAISGDLQTALDLVGDAQVLVPALSVAARKTARLKSPTG